MSREIKFRAWDVITNLGMSKPFGIGQQQTEFEVDGLVYEVTLDFVKHDFMQYTGLKDKNGVEIYEGDIVKGKTVEDDGGGWHHNEKFQGVMEFSEDWGWRLKIEGKKGGSGIQRTADMLMRDFCIIEIIGNIHQNPELLT